jgi:putative peptide zinc metalloprotease protein
MSTRRPLFSESWYRVAEMAPRLRPQVETYRQHYRGRLWHVLRDPSNNKFFRLDEPSHRFVAMLDGRRTIRQVWETTCDQMGDAALTQGEAIQIVGQLYTSNLLDADVSSDTAGIFDRYRERRRREVTGYLMNLLFARIPLYDPDRFLDRWVHLTRWAFGPVGLIFWVLLVGTGLFVAVSRADLLIDQASSVIAPRNLFWLYLAIVAIKLWHEMGHGFACKHFGQQRHAGGEVHTLGVMLLVLVPVPYVDASSAWALRNKWHRFWIGGAGMYFELAAAAVATLVWAATNAQTSFYGVPIHALAYNLMFIAGVSTVLFNANPLIRFDGYYMLSDALEVPNLMQRSKDYLYYLVKKHVYAVRRPFNPAHTPGEAPWLLSYAVLSGIYRILLMVTIILFVADQFFFIGALFAISGIIGFVFVPLGKWIKYLATSPELTRTRSRSVAASAVPITIVLVALAVIPAPEHGRAEGIVEARQRATIVAGADGFLRERASSAARLEPDELILAAENPELLSRQRQLSAQLEQLEVQLAQARSESTARALALLEQRGALRQRLARIQDQVQNLRVQAPFAGRWSPAENLTLGRFIRQGEPLGTLLNTEALEIRITADQALGPRLLHQRELGDLSVQLRVADLPEQTFTGSITRVAPAGQQNLPSAALAMQAGGLMATDPEDPEARRAAEPFFEVRIVPEAVQDAGLYPGQRVVARFAIGWRPLLIQWWDAAARLLQQRFQL